MKKTLTILILFVLTIMISVQVGCGSFTPPSNLPDTILPGEDKPQKPDGDEEEHDIFRVFLVDESTGKPFYTSYPIYAQWTGSDGVYTAQVNAEGYAQVLDLDGDYRVTLSSLPSSYTYDPNNNFVDNVNPDVTIEIKRILSMFSVNDGSGQYDQAHLTSMGTYRVSLGSKNDGIFFNFEPDSPGIYSIESWVDTTANVINPLVDEYIGHAEWNQKSRTVDDGGSESTYTKNFRMEIEVKEGGVGNTFIFAIHADTIGNNYPLTFDFTIKYEGKPDDEIQVYEIVKAKGPFNTGEHKDYPSGTFRYIYGSSRILDSDRTIFNEEDGYYHYYNPQTQKMGGVLYAKLAQDCDVIETGGGFSGDEIQRGLKFSGLDYISFVNTYIYYCKDNADGAHPVNKELKDFLMGFSVSQRYFADGNGWAELHGLNSAEDDQWLFCCGYYA